MTKLAKNDKVLKGKKILIVEDNEINMDVAVHALSMAGARIDGATRGEEALDLVERSKYDLVLLDLTMPGMDGLTVGKIIRTSEENGAVPIVLFTAVEGRDMENAMRELRPEALVGKPVDVKKLISVVAKQVR